MAKQLTCGSKNCWIGATVMALVLCIIGGVLMGTAMEDQNALVKSHNDEMVVSMTNMTNFFENLGASVENHNSRVNEQSKNAGKWLGGIACLIIGLLMAAVFSCGICPMCCFAKDVPDSQPVGYGYGGSQPVPAAQVQMAVASNN